MAAEANKDTCGVREENGLRGVGHNQVGIDRDDVRLGARGEKYDDCAMLCCACHPSNLLSFAFSIYRREKRPRRRKRRRRKRRWQQQLPTTTEDKALAEKGMLTTQ